MDACALINLMNAHQLEAVFKLPNTHFLIGSSAYNEVCKVDFQKTMLDNLFVRHKVDLWDGELDVSLLLHLVEHYNLGDGETEAIAICMSSGYTLCCDDWKARKKANIEIGETKVIGSLRLLKIAVSHDLLKCTDAEISYLEMKLKGGFLPKTLDEDYFCKRS